MTKHFSPAMRYAVAGVLFAALETVLILFADQPLSEYLHTTDARYPMLIDFFRAWTDLGRSIWYLWPAFLGALVCFFLSLRQRLSPKRRTKWQRRGWAFAFVFTCVCLSGIVTDILKPIVGRARPVLLQREGYYGFDPISFHAAHNAFPSGHATTAFALAFALIALFPRWRRWLIAFAIAISLSRIMVNAHFLSDVLAGGVVGLLTVAVMQKLFVRQRLIAAVPLMRVNSHPK